MEELERILTNIANLDEDAILNKVYHKRLVQRFIIDLNTEKQLRLGKNANDDILGFYTSITYSIDKQDILSSKAKFGQVDLFVSGTFYRTFRIIPKPDGFVIEADTDIYDKDFEEIYGNVVGLTDDSKELLLRFLVPFIQEAIRDEILA